MPKKQIVIVADSTVDNYEWARNGGILGSIASDKLKNLAEKWGLITPKGTNEIEIDPSVPSVVNQLKALLPDCDIHDASNDGFTTFNVLFGGYRDKVFGNLGFRKFPRVYFNPLREFATQIENADCIILSIGGNDFREFLQEAKGYQNKNERANFILKNYDNIFTTLKNNYFSILERLRDLNKNAPILLVTQYYPAVDQNTYDIYPFLKEVGLIKNLGNNPNNAMDVIHQIMIETYNPIFDKQPENTRVIDVTSTLPPTRDFHASQIEPDAQGGLMMAQMFAYMINNLKPEHTVTRFDMEFFKASATEQENFVHTTTMKNWRPKHPAEFLGKANYDADSVKRLLSSEQTVDLQGIDQNESLKQAMIILKQTDKVLNKNFLSPENLQKVNQNISLQKALATAHSYLNSGQTGFFSHHGRKGQAQTFEFVCELMTLSNPTEAAIKHCFAEWLKDSSVKDASRTFYAANSGLFSVSGRAYAAATETERKVMLSTMRGAITKKS